MRVNKIILCKFLWIYIFLTQAYITMFLEDD
jgi:hypothetical protein